jgi:hypothetical protein
MVARKTYETGHDSFPFGPLRAGTARAPGQARGYTLPAGNAVRELVSADIGR